jgi:hypothetical protein
MAAAVGFIAWLAVADVRDPSPGASVAAGPPASSSTAAPTPGAPAALDERALRARVRALHQPVFWAGPRQGRRYEFTRAPDGSVFLRYLPAGVRPGAGENRFLMIGTYPYRDAFSAAAKAIRDSPALRYLELPNGALAVFDPARPSSVYLTFPGIDYQIEVFDPSPARARELAVTGKVKRLG